MWLAETHVQNPAVLRTADLITSELVTNALVHAQAAPVLTAERSGEGIVRIAVHDSSVDPPVAGEPHGADGGYGLNLVAAVAVAWGWEPTSFGKSVWADLRVD